MLRRAIIALVVLAGCASSGDPDAETSDRCIVRLHGKGGDGGPTALDRGVAIVAPSGNGTGWSGREWRYATEEDLTTAIDIVRAAVDATECRGVVIQGFSNGASFAAALSCSGETLDDRLVGVLVDDPVTDAATVGCARNGTIPVALYWTGALDAAAPPGTDCASIDWTCAGGTVRGIEAFAADLGVAPQPSPFDEHVPFLEAPEPRRWLAETAADPN